MKSVNSREYDFLWKWGVSYLFMSIYLDSGYRDVDAISYNNGNTNYLFISKDSRKKLSDEMYVIFDEKFDQFKQGLFDAKKRLKKYIESESDVNVSLLSDNELKHAFENMIEHLRFSWASYFPLEPHSLDTIESYVTSYPDSELKAKLKDITEIRQQHRDFINQIMYPPGPFDIYVKEIEKRVGFSVDQFHVGDILDALGGEDIRDRKMADYVIFGSFSNWEPIEGGEAQQIFEQLLPEQKKTELKGSIGNKGYYKGVVRKIEFSLETDYAKEIAEMNKGEVLVSGSTGPEMILACKKAGAIVTEEGGMLTHAAIVSRELGIPCVVGTKVATTVFETGDEIEVDANSGIVRKL